MDGHDLAMALRLAYLTMHRRTDALTARCGVTADQFVVLRALAETGVLSQRELTDRTGSDRNTLRAMLVLLEERELIERSSHPKDKARSVGGAYARGPNGVSQCLAAHRKPSRVAG